MTVYPRTYAQALAMGEHLNENDWNAVATGVAGSTATGTRAYPYTYLFRFNGGYYEAVDSTFNVVFGGSSDAGSIDGDLASAVLQACYDALLTSGGVIQVEKGTYVFATRILVTEGHNIILIGQGSGSNFAQPNTARANRKLATKFEADGALDQILYFVKCVNCKILNIAFSGEDTASAGITCDVPHMIEISDCYFMGFLSDCIKFSTNSDGVGDYGGDNWILRNTFSLADNDVDWCVGIGFQGDANTGGGGTLVSPTEDTLVQGNYFYSYTSKGIGIKLYEPVDRDSTKAYIDSLRIDNNALKLLHYGIQIQGDDGSFFTNNNFESNTVDIVMDATNCQVKSHFLGNRNTIPTVALTRTITGGNEMTTWRDNPGYVNENWGLDYDAAQSSKTVTHGLDASAADVANIVVLAYQSDGKPLKVSNITTTTFDVETLTYTKETTGYETDVDDADTIAHGLGETPDCVLITGCTPTSGAKAVIYSWADGVADATTFTVAINDTDNATVDGVKMSWRASVQSTPKLYTFYWYAAIWGYT